jgi:SAM-dependent methyltransferase
MTVPVEHFERMYERAEDPWGFASRWYEERKRTLLLASLPEPRYATAYEPGCSIGVLSGELAKRCDRLLAADASSTALGRAGTRLGQLPNVRLERHRLPDDWPTGQFDLVVLSELLYYFDPADLADVCRRAVGAVTPGGTLVSVHWRHDAPDHPRRGHEVQRILADTARELLRCTVAHTEDDFELAIHVRPRAGEAPAALSVACRTGLR